MGWFLRALAFHTLYYPWGKMETNRSLRTTRLFLQKPKRNTSYWVQFFSGDIISFFAKQNLLLESLKITKSFVGHADPFAFPFPTQSKPTATPLERLLRGRSIKTLFSVSLEAILTPKRNWRQCLCKILGWQKSIIACYGIFLEWSIVLTSWRGIEYITVRKKKIDRFVVGQGLFVLLLLVQKRYIFWDR